MKNSEEDTISSETRSEEKGKEEVPQLSSPSSQQSSSDVEMHVNADFVKYTCDTRKTAKKEGNIITISSVTESRVKIDGFTSGRNMLGNAGVFWGFIRHKDKRILLVFTHVIKSHVFQRKQKEAFA